MKDILKSLSDRSAKKIAILIDPDKTSGSKLYEIVDYCNRYRADYILVGGSLVISNIHDTLSSIRDRTSIPVLIFPGNVIQVSSMADGILFLSLVSGRNPDYLIGQHVVAAHALKKSGLEIIPVAYILIENGRTTSVEYMSNTVPIPADKTEIVTATALAGEMLGMKLIYLEAGSGAAKSVALGLIREVRKLSSLPLIVGGGIRNAKDASKIFNAGADMVVVGSAVEEDPLIIEDLCSSR